MMEGDDAAADSQRDQVCLVDNSAREAAGMSGTRAVAEEMARAMTEAEGVNPDHDLYTWSGISWKPAWKKNERAASVALAIASRHLGSHPSAEGWLRVVKDDNWDGRGSAASTQQAIDTARNLVGVPLGHGGFQLELHAGGSDVEIEIDQSGAIVSVMWCRALPLPPASTDGGVTVTERGTEETGK